MERFYTVSLENIKIRSFCKFIFSASIQFDDSRHLSDHILTNHPDTLTREDNNSEIERANNEPLEVIEIRCFDKGR